MNKVLKTLFLLNFISLNAMASRCFQVLVVNENDKSRAQLINLVANPNGGYRATHNLPQVAEGATEITFGGKTHTLAPSMLQAPGLHFLYNALRKNVINDREVVTEMIRLSQLPNMRSLIFASGDWYSVEHLERIHQEWARNPGKGIPPIPISMRLASEPYLQSPAEIAQKVINLGPHSMEYLIPKNLMTVSIAQKFTVEGGLQRLTLPWQHYPEYFSHIIPADELACEAGKASAEDTRQFPEMLHASSFVMLKEAVAYARPLDKVVTYVHSPDESHHRLYEYWGLHLIEESKTHNGHRLYFITLREMLELPRFNPAKFSEKIALAQKYSSPMLTAEAAQRLTKIIRDSMLTYLDTNLAPMGSPDSRIRVDDRSSFFHRGVKSLLNAYGISDSSAEYIAELKKIQTSRYVIKTPTAYLPEEFEFASSQNHVFVQELSENLAKADASYVRKTLSAVAKWYLKKMQPVVDLEKSAESSNLFFTIITPFREVADQAASLGFDIQRETLYASYAKDHIGTLDFEKLKRPFYSVSIPFTWIRANLSNDIGATVEQGRWALQNEFENPVGN